MRHITNAKAIQRFEVSSCTCMVRSARLRLLNTPQLMPPASKPAGPVLLSSIMKPSFVYYNQYLLKASLLTWSAIWAFLANSCSRIGLSSMSLAATWRASLRPNSNRRWLVVEKQHAPWISNKSRQASNKRVSAIVPHTTAALRGPP